MIPPDAPPEIPNMKPAAHSVDMADAFVRQPGACDKRTPMLGVAKPRRPACVACRVTSCPEVSGKAVHHQFLLVPYFGAGITMRRRNQETIRA